MDMATVTLRVHLEATGEIGDGFVWWAESDDEPGFSAAADHLPELLARARAALAEIRGEEVAIVTQMEFDDAAPPLEPDPLSTATGPSFDTRQKAETRQEIDTLTAA
jgi:hypothetical protein